MLHALRAAPLSRVDRAAAQFRLGNPQPAAGRFQPSPFCGGFGASFPEELLSRGQRLDDCSRIRPVLSRGGARAAGGKMVGAIGFEPTTSWSQTRRSTRLSYTPTTDRDGRHALRFCQRSRRFVFRPKISTAETSHGNRPRVLTTDSTDQDRSGDLGQNTPLLTLHRFSISAIRGQKLRSDPGAPRIDAPAD